MDNEELAEMEKMLNSGSYPHNLSKTFKQAKEEIEEHASDNDKKEQIQLDSPPKKVVGQNQGENGEEIGDDSAIDLNGLTESELKAIQRQTENEIGNFGGVQQQEASEEDQNNDDELNGGLPVQNVDNAAEIEADEDDEDVIDVDNPEDLARKGLRRIQIEGDEQEYLLDNEGNIYNLQGEFIGTTGDDDEEQQEGEQQEQMA